jgi:chromosome segregation protein
MISRLKSLELQGYKTFASRQFFDFPVEITAVVGPNGAGKSNIADSVRWVLGEQSFSLLRGRKTEDMIFAGSEQRSRANMASATITFNNDDGWLPIDYTEVAVTRRAYRDGQNEYLLNGQRVRLKEISELLAKSGLAERTYTIIGQGLVDAALALKPDERRRFFEEAAGIGLYRSRREESLNRLDATQRNLQRLQDILSELEPRLRSLEKQAKRAQEYEQIKADLQMLLREWYGYHWHRVQQEVAHASEVFEAQEVRLEQARQRQLEASDNLDVCRQQVVQLRERLNNWHTQSAALHQKQEQVSRNLAVIDERKRALGEQQQNLRSDLGRLETEQQARAERLQSLQEEQARLEAELKDAQRQAGEAQSLLSKRQAERSQLEQTLRELRRQLSQLETRQVQQKAHLTELTSRLDTLQRSKITLAEDVNRELRNLQAVQVKANEARKNREQFQLVVDDAEDELQEARRRLQGLEAERKKAVDQNAKLDAEITRRRAQLEVLEQAERSLSGLNQGARFILESMRSGKLRGAYRALSHLIEVQPQYETAVAAVLGELLDGVVLDEGSDPDQALSLLEQGQKGRAVLFTGGSRAGETPFEASQDPDWVGTAASLVHGPSQALIEALFGRVGVVNSREAARRILPGLPAYYTLVTLKGEVFRWDGTIIAGDRKSVV